MFLLLGRLPHSYANSPTPAPANLLNLTPHQSGGTEKYFPDSLGDFGIVGMRTVDEDKAILCCDQMGNLGDVDGQKTTIQKMDPRLFESSIDWMDKGKLFSYEGIIFTRGVSPERISGYKELINYLERTVLQNSSFFQQSNAEIIRQILKSHEFLNLHKTKGFRERYIFVQEGAMTSRSIQSRLRANGGTEKDWNIFTNWYQRTNFADPFNTAYEMATDAEREVLKKKIKFTIPTAPLLIHREMEEFIETLKQMIANEEDPIEIASFVHMKIVTIHPFLDGNGRTARAWMNTILAMYDHTPVIFPSDKFYYLAIKEEIDNPGAFAKYLKNQAIPWTNRQKANSYI